MPILDWSGIEIPQALKAPVPASDLEHRALVGGDFWRQIPAYAHIDETTFLDYRWQGRNTITSVPKLLNALQGLVSPEFIADVEAGFKRAPMCVRISPYLLSLIDWKHPYEDPLRIQFLPVDSRFLPDHPKLGLDSLHEQEDSPTAGLTHRYHDKALMLVIDTCPAYCRFCTRSYAIGGDTDQVEKVNFAPTADRWRRAFAYIASRPEVEDIVVSGGDTYNLRADWLETLGMTLLSMPNIRRIRIASKGLAVMPQKILTDDDWFAALVKIVRHARTLGKDVALHTHFNHPNEITEISHRAIMRLIGEGVFIRNQSVLIRNVNDNYPTLSKLVRRLSYVNVHPYYVYVHDLVKGGEDMRTPLQTALDLELQIRGITAGFNTPLFVVDAPGGGGKRNAFSYEAYDRKTGISVFTAPSVKPGQKFYYFDPIDCLDADARARWADPNEHPKMIAEAEALCRS